LTTWSLNRVHAPEPTRTLEVMEPPHEDLHDLLQHDLRRAATAESVLMIEVQQRLGLQAAAASRTQYLFPSINKQS
jgi:hypothetical protein